MKDYILIRSKRRTLALEVTAEASVIVRAPKNCSKAYIDSFVDSHSAWISDKLEAQKLHLASHPEPSEAEKADCILRAKSELPRRVQYYGKLMGLAPSGISVTGAKKRFGSCSGKNRLCFSWRLMLYPDPAIDYVVVHELAHIVHKNHRREFYALVASVFPDYKARQKLLKE